MSADIAYSLTIQGEEIPLETLPLTVGRNESNGIVLSEQAVSKVHARLLIHQGVLMVQDLNSANGTFVNGRKVQLSPLNHGDEVAFAGASGRVRAEVAEAQADEPSDEMVGGDSALSEGYEPKEEAVREDVADHRTFQEKLMDRFDGVFIPFYRRTFAEIEFPRILIPLVIFIFVILIAVTVIPQIEENERVIEVEAQKRAMLLAKRIIDVNKPYLDQDKDHLLTVTSIMEEPSVIEALIVTSKGKILAPENRYGQLVNSAVVMHALSAKDTYVKSYKKGYAVASHPIYRYDQDKGSNQVHALGVARVSTKTVGRSGSDLLVFWLQIGLFVIVGGILVSFLFIRIFTQPWRDLEAQIEQAMRRESTSVPLVMNFGPVEQTTKSINTLLYKCFEGRASKGVGEADDLSDLGATDSGVSDGTYIDIAADGSIVNCHVDDRDRAWVSEKLPELEGASSIGDVHEALGAWVSTSQSQEAATTGFSQGGICAVMIPSSDGYRLFLSEAQEG